MSARVTSKATVLQRLDVKRIKRNPQQPRIIFDKVELQELADSIRVHGVIEPIVVEQCGHEFILHDGERRWLATKLAGLKKIPAIVGPSLNGTGPRERLERALVANVQRSQMHPIEEGLAYKKLMKDFKYRMKDVAKRTGRAYTRVNYCLNLLKLDKKIQQFMLDGKMTSEDRAVRALLSVPSEARVELAAVLVKHQANATQIVMACKKYNAMRSGISSSKSKKGSLAKRMIDQAEPPEWDALYQLGRVPPWPVVTESVMATCDACPLRKIASNATCGNCGLVGYLRHMMEAARVH